MSLYKTITNEPGYLEISFNLWHIATSKCSFNTMFKRYDVFTHATYFQCV